MLRFHHLRDIRRNSRLKGEKQGRVDNAVHFVRDFRFLDIILTIVIARCSGENGSIRLLAQPCTVMSCLTALDSQIVTLLSVPHEILFLQHKVFREYAKIAVGPDFIHTLPSLLILVSMAIVLWRCPPSYNGLAQITGSVMYKSLQVKKTFLFPLFGLTLLLPFQSCWSAGSSLSRFSGSGSCGRGSSIAASGPPGVT